MVKCSPLQTRGWSMRPARRNVCPALP